jgi:uncharacterized protein YndB with AHSA1/START domain
MELSKKLTTAKSAMLIRKPASQVFNAFIDPDITTKFWFTKSTGKLEEGKTVEWTWEMYDLTDSISVKKIEPNKYIEFDWGTKDEKARTTVELKFEKIDEHSTFVSVENYGFSGSKEEVWSGVCDSTGGFALILAGLKAFLEYNIQLGLVADRFPKGKELKK